MLELEQEIGAKKFQEIAEQKNKKISSPKKPSKNTSKSQFQATKGAPLEKSSKVKPKDLFLQPLNNTLNKHNDPRFSDQHGEFKQANFDKNYEFLDEIEAKEIGELKKLKNKLAKKRHKKS